MIARALLLMLLAGCGGDRKRPTTDVVEIDTVEIDGDGDGIDAPDSIEPDSVIDVAPDSIADTLADSVEPDTVEPDASVDTSDGDVVTPGRAALPPWLTYCDAGCDALAPLVLAVCPAEAPDCDPARATTLVPSVDGHPISAVAFPIGMPDGAVLRVVSGNGNTVANLVTSYAPRVEVRSDLDVTLSYYALPPAWGADVALDFVSATQTSELVDTTFFRHPSYDTGSAAHDLHATAALAIAAERDITGVTSEHVRALFMPMELAAASGGEGNFSYGDGVVTSNYGNPPYIDALGGIMNVAFPRFAHECAHELFDEIHGAFTGDARCLNEGIADALAWLSTYLPEGDFGPAGLRGGDMDDGCTGIGDEIHDVGNCYLWQVKRAGLLDDAFMRRLFHPEHTFDFDSCAHLDAHTGDALLVYFTEAAGGVDMLPVLDAIGIPHAASYDAARAALGF